MAASALAMRNLSQLFRHEDGAVGESHALSRKLTKQRKSCVVDERNPPEVKNQFTGAGIPFLARATQGIHPRSRDLALEPQKHGEVAAVQSGDPKHCRVPTP
jgi:hypothetical protein